jgi:GNAT acetyltransferase-like protein
MDDLDLMRARADTLFTYDARGRMVLTNEPFAAARRPAPRLFLSRTTGGWVLRCGAAVEDSLAGRLASMVDAEPLRGEPRLATAFATSLRQALEQDAPASETEAGAAFRFPTAISNHGDAIRLDASNRSLARHTFPWLDHEIDDWQPCFAVVREGAAVAVCFSARSGPLVAEAGVETLPPFRRRGFATAATAAWGAAVRASGRVPLYSADWDNVASLGVARRLALVRFGSDLAMT